jgi:hypothetical protein
MPPNFFSSGVDPHPNFYFDADPDPDPDPGPNPSLQKIWDFYSQKG